MLQQIIIGIFFTGALAYLARIVWRSFQARSCATGCGKCSTLDVEAIEKQILIKNKPKTV